MHENLMNSKIIYNWGQILFQEKIWNLISSAV